MFEGMDFQQVALSLALLFGGGIALYLANKLEPIAVKIGLLVAGLGMWVSIFVVLT
jgi:hypothetical protein